MSNDQWAILNKNTKRNYFLQVLMSRQMIAFTLLMDHC